MNILTEIDTAIDSIFSRVSQLFCAHQTYRPALVKGKPSRICSDCKYPEEMSDDAFYAQFGERALREMKRRQAARITSE